MLHSFLTLIVHNINYSLGFDISNYYLMIIININLTLAFFNTLDNVKNTKGTILEQTFWFPISYPEFGMNKLWCLTHSLYDPL